MPLYDFRCPNRNCESKFELEFGMDDSDGRAAAKCLNCKRALVRSSYAAVKIPAGWGNFTHYDVLPDNLKGAGPYSKEARDYAERSSPKWDRPRLRTSYGTDGNITHRQDGKSP